MKTIFVDINHKKDGFELVGDEIITINVEPYRITEEQFMAISGKRRLRYKLYPSKASRNRGGCFDFGSYDDFDPCYMLYGGGDTIKLKRYIWEKK